MDTAVSYGGSGQAERGNITLDMTFPWAPPSPPFSSSPYPDPGAESGRGDGSGGGGQEQITLVYIAIFSTLFFAVTTVGICGNAMVIYIIFSDKKMRGSMTNMLILNLAVADSLIMLFGLPEIVLFMMNDGWRLGLVLCKVDRTVLVAALYSSVLTLVAVCIERYIAIVFPFKAQILCTKKRMCKVIAVIWLASCACAAPTAIFNRVRRLSNTPPRDFCLTEFHPNRSVHMRYNQAFKYTESVLFYILPLLLQMVCYTVIGTRLFVGLEKLHRTSGGSGGCRGVGGGGGISSASRPNGRGPPSRGPNSETIRARRGVVKMLIASVIIYFVSYSPHQILLVYRTFWHTEGGFDQTWMFHVFTTILAYVNSAANPVLYCVFSDNFRSNFKVIFARLVSCGCYAKCCGRECSPRSRHGSAETQRAITLHSYTCTTEYSTMARKNPRHSAAVPL